MKRSKRHASVLLGKYERTPHTHAQEWAQRSRSVQLHRQLIYAPRATLVCIPLGFSADYVTAILALPRREGGIVLQPDALEAFRFGGVALPAHPGMDSSERIYLDQNDRIDHHVGLGDRMMQLRR